MLQTFILTIPSTQTDQKAFSHEGRLTPYKVFVSIDPPSAPLGSIGDIAVKTPFMAAVGLVLDKLRPTSVKRSYHRSHKLYYRTRQEWFCVNPEGDCPRTKKNKPTTGHPQFGLKIVLDDYTFTWRQSCSYSITGSRVFESEDGESLTEALAGRQRTI